MSSRDFDYKLRDSSGHNVASLQIDHSGGDGQNSKLVIHLYKQSHSESSRTEALQEYKGFADLLSLKSEIAGGTDVNVTTKGTVPDALMQYVGMDLLKHHKIDRDTFDQFNDAIKSYEATYSPKQVVDLGPAEAAAMHHGQALLRSGAQHTSQTDSQHDPASEKTGMGKAAAKSPRFWEV